MEIIVGIGVYLLPSMIALARHHNRAGSIIAFDVLLGCTGIGWLITLVWACNQNTRRNSAEEATRLATVRLLAKMADEDLATPEPVLRNPFAPDHLEPATDAAPPPAPATKPEASPEAESYATTIIGVVVLCGLLVAVGMAMRPQSAAELSRPSSSGAVGVAEATAELPVVRRPAAAPIPLSPTIIYGDLRVGPRNTLSEYSVEQNLAVKNDSGAILKMVIVECGFFSHGQLTVTGERPLENLQPNQTGYTNVSSVSGSAPDSAKCRVVDFH